MPLTVDDLLRKVWKVDLKNSTQVAVVSIGRNKPRNMLKFKTLTRDVIPVGSTRRVFLREHRQWVYPAEADWHPLRDPLQIPLSQQTVKVSCDCDRFQYFFEVALFKHGAADTPRFANGELPLITNPRMKPGICKHLIQCLKIVKVKGL